MTALCFVIPGEPVPWQRVMPDGRHGGRLLTPQRTRDYESKVKLLGALAARKVRWTIPTREQLKKWPRKERKPTYRLTLTIYRTHEGAGGDLDNYVKAVKDGLNGVAWRDDRYVRSLKVDLLQDAKNPRVVVYVEEWLDLGCAHCGERLVAGHERQERRCVRCGREA